MEPRPRLVSEADKSAAPERLLGASEVARRLGVSKQWLYRAAKDGRIPSMRLGSADGPVRFSPSEIDTWLKDARQRWSPFANGTETLRDATRAVLETAECPRDDDS